MGLIIIMEKNIREKILAGEYERGKPIKVMKDKKYEKVYFLSYIEEAGIVKYRTEDGTEGIAPLGSVSRKCAVKRKKVASIEWSS